MDLLGHLLGNPMLKTGGGASDSEGGGGEPGEGEYESATLIALFKDATNNYATGTWTASNDGTMTMVDNGSNPPAGTDVNNRIEFASFDVMEFGAALASALSGLDNTTTVIGVSADGADCYGFVYIRPSPATTRDDLYITPPLHQMQGLRVSGTQNAAGTGFSGTLAVMKGSVARGGKTSFQLDDNTKVESASNNGDGPTGTVSASASGIRRTSGAHSVRVGFVAFYSGILSDDDYASLLTLVTDNAEFGMGGYSP